MYAWAAVEVTQASLFPVENPDAIDEANGLTILALSSLKGVGFATVKALVDEFQGDVRKVWWADDSLLNDVLYQVRTQNQAWVISQIRNNGKALIADARKQLRKYRDKGTHIVTRASIYYPPRLLDLPNPPSWLFVEGALELLTFPAVVAVVGTRNPSEQGISTSRRASVALARIGAVILSGLAEGIDATGHEVSVIYGAPTVAVLGHGVDVVYPASTAGLRRQIVEHGGAVVSEYLPGDTFTRDKFIQRNRLQSALAHVVCVVEAQAKSGTAHTYRFAKHQQRPIFGVRSGPWRGSPEEELPRQMESEGSPIFDISHEQGCDHMIDFVNEAVTQRQQPSQVDAPRLFKAHLQEIEIVARTYDAVDEDFRYLSREIAKIKKRLAKEREAKGAG